jgi:hypothetical protein
MTKLKEISLLIFETTFILFIMLLEKGIRVINKDYAIMLRGFD